MPQSLDYQNPQPRAAPSQFDFELEFERGTWLRRRFLWYCGLTLVLIFVSTAFTAVGSEGLPTIVVVAGTRQSGNFRQLTQGNTSAECGSVLIRAEF